MVVFQGHVGVVLLFFLSGWHSQGVSHQIRVFVHAVVVVRHVEAAVVGAAEFKHVASIIWRCHILGLVAALVDASAVPGPLGARFGEVGGVLELLGRDSGAVVDVGQLSVSFGSREDAVVGLGQVLGVVLSTSPGFGIVCSHVAVAYGIVDVFASADALD